MTGLDGGGDVARPSHGEGQDEKPNDPTRRGSRRLDAERYRGPGIRHGLLPSAIAMSPQPIIGRALFGVDPASMALPLAVLDWGLSGVVLASFQPITGTRLSRVPVPEHHRPL